MFQPIIPLFADELTRAICVDDDSDGAALIHAEYVKIRFDVGDAPLVRLRYALLLARNRSE